jgi:hypothetical protein
MSTALARRRRVGLSSGRRTEMSGETSDHRGICRGGVLDVLTWPLSSTRWGPDQMPSTASISRSAERRVTLKVNRLLAPGEQVRTRCFAEVTDEGPPP